MIKRECHHKPATKARLIQFYANYVTQSEFGPEFAAFQKSYVTWIRDKPIVDGVHVTIASGMNGRELGEWMQAVHDRFPRPVFYERDGKNWDATMQRGHIDLILPVYSAIDPRLARFAEMGFKCTAVCRLPDGVLIYRITGTVKSGHNDTSSRNSYINAAISASVFHELGLEVEIIVAGDDLLVAVGSDFDLATVMALEARRGIVPEARKFTSYQHVSFISGCWIMSGPSFLFVPLLGRLLARLWWTVKPPGKKHERDYIHSVCLGLAPLVGELPVYRVLLSSHDRGGKLIEVDKGHKYICPPAPETVDYGIALGSLSARYGVASSELEAFEEELAALAGRKCIFRNAMVDQIESVDLADLATRATYPPWA
jgi:hypothetical protein